MQPTAHTQFNRSEPVLCLAFELGDSRWHLGMKVSEGQRTRRASIPAGDLGALSEQIRRGKERFGLVPSARVVSCYEAGRDGFWLHRYLEASGVANYVIDASSPQVDRRKRRAKTDRLDLEMLLSHLMRHQRGESRVWRVVRVPSREAEDARHLHRELEVLKRDRVAIGTRIRSLLVTQGVRLKVTRRYLAELELARRWDGSPIDPGLRERLEREYGRWLDLSGRIQAMEARRKVLLKESKAASVEKVRDLMRLRSMGPDTAWPLVMECLGHREFRNRRQVGGYVGLCPTPYDSGKSRREQGISKAGNARVRWRMIQLAWGWLRWQPDSELARWYERRFGQGSKRSRRIGIVALARKLLIALWRYLDFGIVPDGAVLKA